MDTNKPLSILILSSEVSPFVKTGGIADVVGELPKALRQLGHDARVVLPRYESVDKSPMRPLLAEFPVPFEDGQELASVGQGELPGGVPVYFVQNPRLFNREGLYMYPDDAERFIFFCRAALEMLPRLGWRPDIMHSNDWQTAIVPNWLKTIYASSPFFRRTATAYTIHNLAYQGIFGQRVLEIAGLAQYGFIVHPQVPNEINDVFDFMARGIMFSDAFNTVSETYAREIQTPEFGEKLDPVIRMRSDRLRGILNGIDYDDANPAADPALSNPFDADHLERRAPNKRALQELAGLPVDSSVPLLGMVSRLTEQKGLDLVCDVIDHVLDLGVQFVVLGSGDQHYHKLLADLEGKYPTQMKAFLTFDQVLSRRILAGSEILLMPSKFEPSGTTQLLAMHYGCVPVVRSTGGLADSVSDFNPQSGAGTGFVFRDYDRWALFGAIARGLEELRRPEVWRVIQRSGMRQDFSWKTAAARYVDMYRFALGGKIAAVSREERLSIEIEQTAQVMASLPERIRPLHELVYNLWWSWNADALELFRRIDPDVWDRVRHNPVRLLREVSPQRLAALAEDEDFILHYERVQTRFDHYMRPSGTWFESTYPYIGEKVIAYFCAEFGLHESLPIYSGGMGILAGDHTKESSDLGLPLIGIGFLYPQGYFRQQVDAAGNQVAIYDKLNFAQAPALPARDSEGKEVMVGVDLPGRTVYAKVWQIQVGRVNLFLMDTDVEVNAERDRELAARLYGGDHELRIMQEIVLGIGGVRVLRALGLEPSVYHMNEGHSTFLVLELIREMVAKGYSFDAAKEEVAKRSIFTVHTPVAAGNDAFSADLMDKYFGGFFPKLGISRERFLALAQQDGSFSMTVLGLTGAGQRIGVSERHGQVSRQIWHFLWPDMPEEQVPIGHITNGVHKATWQSPGQESILEQVYGEDWYDRLDSLTDGDKLDGMGPKWWQGHRANKGALIEHVRNKNARRLERLGASRDEMEAARRLLDPNALTIAFARRFATYKRATLMFRDPERLKRILNQSDRPVQIIFAGKAHPADEPGKDLLRAIIRYTREPGFSGSVVFLEDYGIDDARLLVRGVDVWLNNPRPPQEASGTSGEKAGLNGVLNLSILDGWWIEGWNGENGWAIGEPNRTFPTPDAQDEADALSLYNTLEQQVVPLYYRLDSAGLPVEWISRCMAAIRSILPKFSTRRMVKEYVSLYLNAMIAEELPTGEGQAVKA